MSPRWITYSFDPNGRSWYHMTSMCTVALPLATFGDQVTSQGCSCTSSDWLLLSCDALSLFDVKFESDVTFHKKLWATCWIFQVFSAHSSHLQVKNYVCFLDVLYQCVLTNERRCDCYSNSHLAQWRHCCSFDVIASRYSVSFRRCHDIRNCDAPQASSFYYSPFQPRLKIFLSLQSPTLIYYSFFSCSACFLLPKGSRQKRSICA